MALHSFDTLQQPNDILRVNCNCPEFDQQLFGRMFVADEIENLLGVDLSNLDVPPPVPKLATDTPFAPVVIVTVSFKTLNGMQRSAKVHASGHNLCTHRIV